MLSGDTRGLPGRIAGRDRFIAADKLFGIVVYAGPVAHPYAISPATASAGVPLAVAAYGAARTGA
jgi:hypothetical protein